MRAVAVHTFAGGFLIGVRQAGFKVGRAYEPLDFGTGTLRGMGVRVLGVKQDWDEWPMPAYRPDLVFGNPRCGGFSGLNSNHASDQKRGAGCQQSRDFEQLCCFGARRARARVIVAESVQALYTGAARPFLDRMVDDVLHPAGYRVGHVFINAAALGSPQFRRRYFMVAWREGRVFHVVPPRVHKRAATVWDCIGDLDKRKTHGMNLLVKNVEYDDDVYSWTSPKNAGSWNEGANSENFRCIPKLEQGEGLNNLHHRYGSKIFKRLGCPRFYARSLNAQSIIPFAAVANAQRLYADRQCPTMTGASAMFVHPHHDRTLTVRELCRLMGWPDDVTPVGKDPGGQLALGVIPAAGKWIADSVHRCLSGDSLGEKLRDGELLNFNKHIPPKVGNVRRNKVYDDVDKI